MPTNAQKPPVRFGAVKFDEVNPRGGKIARMAAASPEFQAHDWYFKRNAAWTGVLVEQLLAFPRGRHDDLCDAISQAAIWLAENQVYTGPALFDVIRREYTLPWHKPQPKLGITPEIGQKVINGEPLSDAEMNSVIFAPFEDD
jgi:hypothetical protein